MLPYFNTAGGGGSLWYLFNIEPGIRTIIQYVHDELTRGMLDGIDNDLNKEF
jgi:hypothetical protein